ncbi:MAG: SpoIID/LytB domain-containing protein [Acidimicrobiales bacterium]
MHSCRSRILRVGATVAVAVLLLPLLASGPAAAATGTATVEISGRGWGHGRGLGQYGALGYAQDHGWDSGRILDHFYSGTSAGTVPADNIVDPNHVRVDLSYNKGRSTAVGLESGRILMRGPADEDLGYISEGAVRVRWDGNQYVVSFANSCAGPWTVLGGITGHSGVRLIAETSADPNSHESMLHVCRSGSARTWYSGEIVATYSAGNHRTVNLTTIEEYLRGVVPNESPAKWPAAALEAQAVAARSYAMAGDTRHQPWADTCETTRCQVFWGRFHQKSGAAIKATTDPRTDAAIAATTGVVRLNGAGRVARTEFSSSTGGHTAGGTFASVKDDGDNVESNPNRQWTKTVDVSALEAKFGRGKLLDLAVTGRNGLGADGGRVTQIEFRFENGTVTQTGWKARTTLGLKSDWFTVGPIIRAETAQIGQYVESLADTFLGADPSAAQIEAWSQRIYTSQDRVGVATEIVQSDAFAGTMLLDLYETAFGRQPDAEGAEYWKGVMRSGARFDDIGAYFLASDEYYLSAGSTPSGFVATLYRDILHRDPDSAGLAYWVDLMNSGRISRIDVGKNFYMSLESRRDRTERMYKRVFGREPSAESMEYWSNRLLSIDDVSYAIELATSDRFYTGSQR